MLFGGHSTGGAVGVAIQAKCKQTSVTMAESLGNYENWTLQQARAVLHLPWGYIRPILVFHNFSMSLLHKQTVKVKTRNSQNEVIYLKVLSHWIRRAYGTVWHQGFIYNPQRVLTPSHLKTPPGHTLPALPLVGSPCNRWDFCSDFSGLTLHQISNFPGLHPGLHLGSLQCSLSL